jgi:phosphate-selective porin OprO and OprP
VGVLRSLAVLCFIISAGLQAGSAAAQQEPSLGTVKPAGKEPVLTVGGLLQMQADFADRGDARFTDDHDRFYLRRARLNAAGRFLEEFDFRLELDLAGGLSNTSGLRAQMTDGYINWNRFPAANVRAGQFKTPFGFEQLYADPRLTTIERSLVNDRLTLNRQIGVQVGGDLVEKNLSYAIGVFNGSGANDNFNDNDKFLWAGRFAGVLWQQGSGDQLVRWSVGGNAFRSDDTGLSEPADFRFDATPASADVDNLFTGRRSGLGLDTQLQAGRLEIWAEALAVRWEPESRRPRSRVDSRGWYVQGSWYLLPQRVQAVAKFETFDPDRSAKDDDTSTGTLGLNWYLKGDDLKLMLDYLRVDAAERPGRENKVLARFQVGF